MVLGGAVSVHKTGTKAHYGSGIGINDLRVIVSVPQMLAMDGSDGHIYRDAAGTPFHVKAGKKILVKETLALFRHLTVTDPAWQFPPDHAPESLAELQLFDIDSEILHPSPFSLSTDFQISRGDNVSVVCSPFASQAPLVFVNSMFHTTVAGLFHQHNVPVLGILDLRFLPGMEGGSIIREDENCCVGIIVPPLIRTDVQGFDLTFFIPWTFLCSNYLDIQHSLHLISPATHLRQKIANACDSVVLITISNTWGSGVFISESLILTNRHVVRPILDPRGQLNGKLEVTISRNGTKHVTIAKILFASSEFWDVAILEVLHEKDVNVLPISSSSPKTGSAVVAIGWGGFKPSQSLAGPFFTKGILGKKILNPRTGDIARYQTSAFIDNGAR
ncbi:Peroxisomal leader peptide-processing protease [Phlyctochytrium planicorne]|nr:Peroxisomal leader peptide-processing protease [Phlyctochytrium planicorne]